MPGTRKPRRSYDDMIQALRQKIAKLEDRKRTKTVRVDPTLRLAAKLVRSLKKAEEQFQRANRTALASATRAAWLSLDGSASGANGPPPK